MEALKLKLQFVKSLTWPFQADPFPSIRILKLQGCHSTHNMQFPPPASSGSLHVVVFMCAWIRTRRTSTTDHYNRSSNTTDTHTPQKLFRLYFPATSSKSQINTLFGMETPWKRTGTAPQPAGTFLCSRLCSVAVSKACSWRSFIELCSNVSVKQPPAIPHPQFKMAPKKVANFIIITNQLNTLIRQYTLLLLTIFPPTHFCSGESIM